MAKRKTNKQQNITNWYNKYRLGLQYYDISIKELKRPTAKSLSKAKSQWKGIQQQRKKAGFKDNLTIHEAVKYMQEHPQSKEPQVTHNQVKFDKQYIQDCINEMMKVTPRDQLALSTSKHNHYWNWFNKDKSELISELNKSLSLIDAIETELNNINFKLETGDYDFNTFDELQNRYTELMDMYDSIIQAYTFNLTIDRIREIAQYYINDTSVYSFMENELLPIIKDINSSVQV